MDSALYTAASGMIARQRELEVVANNLANVSVHGFRPEATFYEVFNRVARGADGSRNEASNNEVHVPRSFSLDRPGALLETGGALDLAIEGDGWFVAAARGGERYTRGGSMRLAADATLVTADGDPLLGAEGPIKLPPGTVSIGADGKIEVDGAQVARVRLVKIPLEDLEREGASLHRLREGSPPPAAEAGVRVRQGNLEASGINPVEELVRLVAAQRAFEQHARTVNLIMNEINRKAVTEIAQP